jgi:predicted ATPase
MDRITALTAQLDPMKPVPADDNQIYVDWQRDLMGADDVKLRLVRTFARSTGAPVSRLFTGHRGTGKTTELLRVQKMLMEESRSRKLFVSFLECEEWLDLTDVTADDLILQMVRQLVNDLRAQGFHLGWEKFIGFFSEAWEILRSDVEFKDIEIGGDPVKLGGAIKHIPGARAKLRKFLEDRRPKLLDLVNQQIIGKAKEFLMTNGGYNDILLIVDQLDRIPQKQLNDKGLTNHEQLFLNSADPLRGLNCDVLYTIPIELAYSHCQGRLSDAYGGELLSLPMIEVPGQNEAGLNQLLKILRKRAEAAGVKLEEICSAESLRRLCLLSGGHPRSLFSLLQAALHRSDDLPIEDAIIERAIRSEASNFGKALTEEMWRAIQLVQQTKRRLPAGDQDALWMTFLRERYAYAYYDAETEGLHYDWNPLLGEIAGHVSVKAAGDVREKAAAIRQKLTELELTNFRCFSSLRLTFDHDWTCLAGINGAGKSSILQAIAVLILGPKYSRELGAERLANLRTHGADKAEIKATFRADDGTETLVLMSIGAPSEGVLLPAGDEGFWRHLHAVPFLGYGASRNLSSTIDSRHEGMSLEARRQMTLFDSLTQVAAAEVLLGAQPADGPLRLVERALRSIFDDDLRLTGGTSLRFTLGNRGEVGALDLPDGFRSSAAWIADLCVAWHRQNPKAASPADVEALVLIDEVDLHLHPSLQRKLVPRLRKTFPKVQWIVSTHSPLVLANFDRNEIVALDRNREGNIRVLDREIKGFTSDEIYEWLMDTRPTGVAIEEELRDPVADARRLAELVRMSPSVSEEEARSRVARNTGILAKLDSE